MSIGERVEDAVAAFSCNFRAFVFACLVVLIWAALGPHYEYSDTWQLIINTGTTIVTFLMAFLIAANQRRADMSRERLLELIEQHIEAQDGHMRETHNLLREVHKLTLNGRGGE